jgi:hypothetical protein
VRIDPLFQRQRQHPCEGSAYVTFQPGVRSAWHTRPLGQMLIVPPIAGSCRPGASPLRSSTRMTSSGSSDKEYDAAAATAKKEEK